MGMGTSRTRRGGGASLADGAETPPITPETARRQGGTGTNRGQRSATSSSPPLNKRSGGGGAAPSPSTHSSSASSYAGGGRHGKTRIGRSQPTDIAAGGNSIIMPFSPSSGINMAEKLSFEALSSAFHLFSSYSLSCCLDLSKKIILAVLLYLLLSCLSCSLFSVSSLAVVLHMLASLLSKFHAFTSPPPPPLSPPSLPLPPLSSPSPLSLFSSLLFPPAPSSLSPKHQAQLSLALSASPPPSPPAAILTGKPHPVSPSKRVPTGTERIPTVITWASGGKQVAVTGTWNNWKEAIPLNKSEHDFATILELPPGVHQYKFLVDGKWKHAPDQPVAVDTRGNLTNCMEVKEFRLEPIFLGKGSPPGSYSTAIPPEILTPRPVKEGEGEDDEDDEEETKKKKEREENGRSNNLRTVEEDEEFQLLGMALSAWSDIEMGENFPYSTDKEDEDEEDGERNRNRKEKDSENATSEEEEGDEEDNEREGRRKKGANTKNTPPTYPILKEPPTLPPHLLKAVLNHQMEEDPTVLPLPHHVMLNHLYFKEYDSEDEDMDDACVVGTTYRYRQKFVTTVFYRPATLRPRAAKNSPPTPAATKEGEPTATNATQQQSVQAV